MTRRDDTIPIVEDRYARITCPAASRVMQIEARRKIFTYFRSKTPTSMKPTNRDMREI